MDRVCNIFLINLIGSYSGCEYYDTTFARELQRRGYNVKVLSTFSLDDEKPFLKVMFNKNLFLSIILMFKNYIRLLLFVLSNRKSVFIFMSFGEVYEFLFLSLSLFCKNFFVDIHEIYANKYVQNQKIKCIFNLYYRHIIRKVVYHSDKTKTILNQIEFKGSMLYVPHFKYHVDSIIDISKIGKDLIGGFQSKKIKMLYFGNLRKVKGIDIVVDFFTKQNVSDKVELIIAGKNVEEIDLDGLRNSYKVADRHINDDELKYLFKNTDYVLLPYLDSSQSGILEMSFCFRKPMLLTKIPYFLSILNNFPSFGKMSKIEDYGNLLEQIVNGQDNMNYYDVQDCNKFMMEDEIKSFMDMFRSLII